MAHTPTEARPSETQRASEEDWLVNQRILALCGIAAPLLFAILVFIASSTWEGYSHQTQTMSELGGVGAPAPAIQNFNFFLAGVLIVAFSLGLYREFDKEWRYALGPMLIGVWGLAVAIQPVFPCDPNCDFITVTGSLHNISALIGFLAFLAGTLVLSRRMREHSGMQAFSTYTAITGIAALGALLLWLVGGNVFGLDSIYGILQRIFIGVVFLWFLVMGIVLYRHQQ